MTPAPDIKDIAAALAGRIEALVRELLPAGRRVREEWVVAGGDSPFGCSLGVRLRPPRQGVWAAWAAGASRVSGTAGDALDLVAQLRFGGDKGAALRWGAAWLGGAAATAPAPAARAGTPREEAGDEEERSRKARAIWLGARPSLKGTPGEFYLRRRGIDLAALGRQPRALRFAPALWEASSRRSWPALVAAINRGPAIVAVHRIFLTPTGEKAPVADPKQSFGPKKGGYVPLWRGASGKPLGHAPAGSTCWLSEGIEDGLAVALLTGGADRVLAAIDLGNMASLALPASLATIVIAGQHDPYWSERQDRPHGAAAGLARAIRHFQDEGRAVRVWRPPHAASGKDANDYLRWLQRQQGEEQAA